MLALFSDDFKYGTWRRLWVVLAEGQKILGLPITANQIKQMKSKLHSIDYKTVAKYEKEFNHDVMAHLYAFGDVAPLAKPILHLGATSAYLTDNGDLIQYREALDLIAQKLRKLISSLASFAKKYKATPCLSFTHLQPAQPTTVGKRACLWLQDLLMDQERLEFERSRLAFLGLKGASGSQSSYLNLFSGNASLVDKLETHIAKALGFTRILPLSGQTYTRKQDVAILQVLEGIAISCHKWATDLRLLASMREWLEPFEKRQVGSSAMPHKRNPILAERVCSLARFIIALQENGSYTAATQWLERSLDDSANRRLVLPDAFLACDALLDLMEKIISKGTPNPKMIQKHLDEELPFLLTEEWLMEAVKKGGDRQKLHEKLRRYCVEAEGDGRKLLEMVEKDKAFPPPKKKVFTGRSEEQVNAFLKGKKLC